MHRQDSASLVTATGLLSYQAQIAPMFTTDWVMDRLLDESVFTTDPRKHEQRIQLVLRHLEQILSLAKHT